MGFNKVTQKLRVLKKVIIKKSGDEDEDDTDGEASYKTRQLQTEAIRKIIELFYAFKCKAVYVDKGYGGYQCEYLEKFFFENGYENVFRGIDFGSSIKEINPFTGENINKRLKGVMVYSLQQQFEKGRIELSPLEEGRLEDTAAIYEDCIVYQMQYYSVDHYDGKDNPVFTHKGDHILDAFMLANYAFVDKIEKSIHFQIETSALASVQKNVIEETNKVTKIQRNNFLELFSDRELSIETKHAKKENEREEDEPDIFFVTNKKKKGLFNKKKSFRSSFL